MPRSRDRVLTGLSGDAPHVRKMRDFYKVTGGENPTGKFDGDVAEALETDTVQSARGKFQLTKPLRRLSSMAASRPRVAKIIEAELKVVMPGDGAKPKHYHVILTGDIDRPGSGVLEFYIKSGTFKKKYNLSYLPKHKFRIDESSIDISHPNTGTVQLVHAKKGPYSLRSSDDLSAWATALESLVPNRDSNA